MSIPHQPAEGFAKAIGDAQGAGGHAESALSGNFLNLMKEGLQGIFKGAQGGDPFNFQKMQQEITQALSQDIYGGHNKG